MRFSGSSSQLISTRPGAEGGSNEHAGGIMSRSRGIEAGATDFLAGVEAIGTLIRLGTSTLMGAVATSALIGAAAAAANVFPAMLAQGFLIEVIVREFSLLL